MRRARILYWGEAARLVGPIQEALSIEFAFGNSLTQDVGPYISAEMLSDPFQVLDALFLLAERVATSRKDLAFMLAPVPLMTPFGYRIAGESRGKCIAVSSLMTTSQNLPRLLRHEIGHYFGLSEHLGCVMSPYTVEEPRYCQDCVSRLRQHGVNWQESGDGMSACL